MSNASNERQQTSSLPEDLFTTLFVQVFGLEKTQLYRMRLNRYHSSLLAHRNPAEPQVAVQRDGPGQRGLGEQREPCGAEFARPGNEALREPAPDALAAPRGSHRHLGQLVLVDIDLER